MTDDATMLRIIFISCGVFAIAAAYFNWDFYFQDRKAKRYEAILGREGARGLIFIIGVVAVAGSVASFYWQAGGWDVKEEPRWRKSE